MAHHQTISKVTIQAPAARVWEAVTKPELVKQWQYGADLITDWQKGSPIVYRNTWGETVYEQKGTILEIEPGKKVTYSLFAPRPGLEERIENFFIMTYLLEEFNGQTTLTIMKDDPRETPAPAETDVSNAEAEQEESVFNSLKRLLEA